MSNRQFISDYCCQEVPASLYRVQHAESQAQFDSAGDLVPRSNGELPQNVTEFKTGLQNHFRWGYSQSESSFMSLFDCEERAIDWGKKRYYRGTRHGSGPVQIHKVNTIVLSGIHIFKVDDLCRRLDITLNRDVAHEYLVALRIPAAALHIVIDIETLVGEGQSPLQKIASILANEKQRKKLELKPGIIGNERMIPHIITSPIFTDITTQMKKLKSIILMMI